MTTAKTVSQPVIAWAVLDCIHLKPSSVTLDASEVEEYRPEHVIKLVDASAHDDLVKALAEIAVNTIDLDSRKCARAALEKVRVTA